MATDDFVDTEAGQRLFALRHEHRLVVIESRQPTEKLSQQPDGFVP